MVSVLACFEISLFQHFWLQLAVLMKERALNHFILLRTKCFLIPRDFRHSILLQALPIIFSLEYLAAWKEKRSATGGLGFDVIRVGRHCKDSNRLHLLAKCLPRGARLVFFGFGCSSLSEYCLLLLVGYMDTVKRVS